MKIDEYIEKLDSPKREVAEALCRLVAEEAPEATGAIKWGMPNFEQNGSLCYIDGSRRQVNFGFFQSALLPDPDGLLEGTGKAMRHIKVRDLERLPEESIRALIRAAVRLNAGVDM